MGYVYTPEEFVQGRIASPDDYKRAMKMLIQGLEDMYGQGLVYGANIHGSIFHPDGGLGSDIDVLVVMNNDEAVYKLNGLRHKIKDHTYVPVEFMPLFKEHSERGWHQINSYYMQYITTFCKDGIVGNDPAAVIKPLKTWGNPLEEVKERLEAQIKGLIVCSLNLRTFIYGISP